MSHRPGEPKLAAVLDMGASAVRLVVAELTPGGIRQIDEASKGVLLGRDTFASGVIRSQTVDATCTALEGFRELMSQYDIQQVRAVATSAVREARNSEMFLDRVRARTGLTFEVINEAEESRLIYLAVRQMLLKHAAFTVAWTLIAEVGGGNTSLTLLRRGQPNRSGVYALGAVRLRQQLDLRRHTHDLQLALLKRSIANVVDEIRLEIPLSRISQFVALGGDVRFAASQMPDAVVRDGFHEVPREQFLKFCDDVEGLDADGLVDRFRLRSVEAETFLPAMLVYRTLFAETAAKRVVVSDASLRTGILLDLARSSGRLGAEEFEGQVLASAEALGHRYRFDKPHGQHVAHLAVRLFDELAAEHGLSVRDRLLLQVAALLHDIGIYVSLRGHHKHSQYLLSASQIFGLSDEETAIIANIARYHRRGVPQRSHVAFIALDRQDRLIVSKLAAILRVANALDAEHLQKVHDIRLVQGDRIWTLELVAGGDVTMEQMAAMARADLFNEVFGRQLTVRSAGVAS